MKRFSFLILVGFVLHSGVSGCRDDAQDSAPPQEAPPASEVDDPGDPPTPKLSDLLVAPENLARIEGELNAIVERNKAKKCPHATWEDGHREDKGIWIIQVMEGEAAPKFDTEEDAFRACHDLLDNVVSSDAFLDRYKYGLDGPAPEKYHGRLQWAARPFFEKRENGIDIVALEEACAPLFKKLREVNKYTHTCSPYLPGKRGRPELRRIMRIARLSNALAIEEFKENRWKEGFRILTHTWRFSQHLSRGGSGILYASMHVATTTIIRVILEEALNQSRPIPEEALRQLVRDLEIHMETEPMPGEILLGENEHVAIYVIWPGLHSAKWVPPGGWVTDGPFAVESFPGLSLKATATLMMEMNEFHRRAIAEACPEKALVGECLAGVKRVFPRLLKEYEDLRGDLLEFQAGTSGIEDLDLPTAKRLMGLLSVLEYPSWAESKYIRRLGISRFNAAVSRLHAHYRLLYEQSGKCPAFDAFSRPPLSEYMEDPNTDGLLVIEEVYPGRFRVKSTMTLEDSPNPDAGEDALEFWWLIECPQTRGLGEVDRPATAP